MSEQAVLAFILDSPLQSWGVESRYQQRGTAAFPSKSGIVGLLAAALGIDKHLPDEAAKIAPLGALGLAVVRGALGPSGAGGRLSDFHTLGGGYDKSSSWQKLSTPRKAGGGTFGTVVTRRTYLAGCCFVALLEGDAELLKRVAVALRDPVWGGWLGRKSCIPARPFGPAMGATQQLAFDAIRAAAGFAAASLESFDRQLEVGPAEVSADVFYQADHPQSFAERQHYARAVRCVRAVPSAGMAADQMFARS